MDRNAGIYCQLRRPHTVTRWIQAPTVGPRRGVWITTHDRSLQDHAKKTTTVNSINKTGHLRQKCHPQERFILPRKGEAVIVAVLFPLQAASGTSRRAELPVGGISSRVYKSFPSLQNRSESDQQTSSRERLLTELVGIEARDRMGEEAIQVNNVATTWAEDVPTTVRRGSFVLEAGELERAAVATMRQ